MLEEHEEKSVTLNLHSLSVDENPCGAEAWWKKLRSKRVVTGHQEGGECNGTEGVARVVLTGMLCGSSRNTSLRPTGLHGGMMAGIVLTGKTANKGQRM